MRSLLALFAMLGFVLSTVLGIGPSTREGLQCVTASVQTVLVRDCCGRLVARAPKPGEKDFKQCRCAEKRQGALHSDAAPRHEALPPTRLTMALPPSPPPHWTIPAYRAGRAEWSVPPPLRPPSPA